MQRTQRVDEEALLPCNRMRSHHGVDASYARASLVLGFQTVQSFRNRRRQLLIRERCVDEDSIPADVRALKHIQEYEAWWLLVRTAIHVPRYRSGTRRVNVAKSGVTDAVVCDVDLRTVWEIRSSWENYQRSEVFAEVYGGGDGQVFEVLRAKSDDFALGYEESDFVFYLRPKAAELDAGDLRARGRCQAFDVDTWEAEVGEGWISVFGMFEMVEGFKRRIFPAGREAGEVMGILRLCISKSEKKYSVIRTFADAKCLPSSCSTRDRGPEPLLRPSTAGSTMARGILQYVCTRRRSQWQMMVKSGNQMVLIYTPQE